MVTAQNDGFLLGEGAPYPIGIFKAVLVQRQVFEWSDLPA